MRRVDRNWSSWTPDTRPQPGDFQITPDGDKHLLRMMLPGGYLCAIPIRIGPKETGAWQWDGNEDAPTVKPSVDHFSGHGEERISLWHGFIKKGQMEGCP